MTILKLPKPRQRSVAKRPMGAPAMFVPFPLNRTSAVKATVFRMEQHKIQKPARAELRATLKASAKDLRALGVGEERIQLNLQAFAEAVRAHLHQRNRKRIAGAADQVATKITVRIGERAAAAARLPAMPKAPPPEPHFRIRFPNKVALHPTWWRHRSRDVGKYADFILRERYPSVAEFHLQRSGNVVRWFLERLFIDDVTIDRHARGFEARVRAEVWRRVLLDHDPTRKANDEHDRG